MRASELERDGQRETDREKEREERERAKCLHTHGARSTNTVSIHVGTTPPQQAHSSGFRV